MTRIINRIKLEPVLLGTLAVAIANLFITVTPELESGILVIVGVIIRHFVTPTESKQ